MNNTIYLGDGLYAKTDGFNLDLYSSNGVLAQNILYFEPESIKTLLEFIKEKYPNL